MGATDKAKHAAQHAKGKVKAGAGRVTGNDRLRAEGERDQASAHVKHAADKAKDTVKHGAQAAKGAAKEGAGKLTGKDRLAAKGKAEREAANVKEKLNK